MTLLELFDLLKKHMKLVVGLPVICALLVAVYSFIGMPNTYTATTSLYVLTSQDQSSSNLSSDLSASQMVANDVTTLLESNRVQNATADDLGLKNLSDFEISVSSATTSRVIELSVTGTDPQQVAEVANAIADNVSAISQDVMKVQAVNIIDQAVAPQAPSGPKRPLYVAVACMGGLFAAVAIVVVADMLNMKVRSAEEVEELLGVPVIGRIPLVKGGR